MARREPDEMQELLAESRAAMATLTRLTTRLEAFTDRLESDLRREEVEDDEGPGGTDRTGSGRPAAQ